MTKYETNVWYGWNGGECPVHPETMVQAVFSDLSGFADGDAVPANEICWDSEGSWPCAFRVVNEHKEPREFWAFMMAGGYWIESVPEAEGAVLFREVVK